MEVEIVMPGQENAPKKTVEKEFVKDKKAELPTKEIITQRKERLVSHLKKNYNWLIYLGLSIIVFLAVKIRTSNLPGLRDITNGEYTLGPDADPFLFLRWVEYIVEHGSLMAVDTMRYVPLGYNLRGVLSGELVLHPYLMAWFHKLAVIFGSESVTQSVVIYPVFMFAITVVAFFLFTRKIFVDSLGNKNASILALIASFFLTIAPDLINRTIAGIPEKESAAFFFLFMTFYLFISAWKAKSLRVQLLFAVGAGIATASMALIWGGYSLIFFTIPSTVLIAFLIGKVDKNKLYFYTVWMLTSFIIMNLSTTRYAVKNFFLSPNQSPAIVVFIIIAFHLFIYPRISRYIQSQKLQRIPSPLISTIISGIIMAILGTIFISTSFIQDRLVDLFNNLTSPATTRLLQTVGENLQTYFTEWAFRLGLSYKGIIPVVFWLFFLGAIYLFYKSLTLFKQNERINITLAFLVLLLTTIFTRYSKESVFNGGNFLSLFTYFLGFAIFIGVVSFYYFKYYKNNQQDKLKRFDFGILLLLFFMFLGILGTRGMIRLIIVLAPSVAIIISYLAVTSFNDARKFQGTEKIIALLISAALIITILFTGYLTFKLSYEDVSTYSPTPYSKQWQKAMFWVRENTPEDAVFAHWWDYGYWVQTIGKRATILDGGNAISYWNYLMSRHVLTSPDEQQALEFLYAHNATHLLIDSQDIGKYSAYSLIGSDENFDRYSLITILHKSKQTRSENSIILSYPSYFELGQDIIFNEGGEQTILPARSGATGPSIIIEKDLLGNIISKPKAIYSYQGERYTLELRYAFEHGKLIDFGSGVEEGVYLLPKIVQKGNSLEADLDGTLLYLNQRTFNSQFTKLYLFNEQSSYFTLTHTEDDLAIAELKAQNPNFEFDIVYKEGLYGPIKIWETSYPSNIKFNPEYIETQYPEELQIFTSENLPYKEYQN